MRIVILIIQLVLGMSMVYAQSLWTDRGHYSISWFNSTKSEFEISTAEEFAGIAILQNEGYTDFKNKTIILKNDINLNGRFWTPIGDKANPFRGKIEGNGHTIKGISIIFNTTQYYFGLFGAVNNASMKNFILKGKISINIENYYTTQYVGSCCGYASESTFDNIISNVDVRYNRETNSSDKYEICVGGFAGYLYDCDLKGIQFNSEYYVHFGGSSPYGGYLQNSKFDFGGLFASGYNSKINFCSVISKVYVYLGGSENLKTSNSVGFGGIAGQPSSCLIQGCRVIMDSVEINQGWKPGLNGNIYLGGISVGSAAGSPVVKRGICNCYAVILNAQTSISSGKCYYGGIISYNNSDLEFMPDQFVFNYSNKDFTVKKTIGNLSIASFIEGYNGFDDFSSAEMKAQSFVNELNLYYTLNGKDCHWYYVEGDYPHISIEPIKSVEAENITLNIDKWSSIIGETVQLEATVLPEDTTDKTLEWKSSNDAVAIVDEYGLVTAISEGTATITVTCGEASAQCEITVLEEDAVEELFVNPDSKISIYSIDGTVIKKDCKADDLRTLVKGIYIIVYGKDRYKVSI